MMQSCSPTLTQSMTTLRVMIDSALERYTNFSSGCPEKLRDAIRHSLLGGGKRLRPMMTLWAAEACGGAVEVALPAACAVEMVHTYSLIHDDLPAMDDDDLRRGRPTCHKVYGEAMAILAGDALLALAFQVLADDILPQSAAAACCGVLATAAGPTELVGGQADDLCGEFLTGNIDILESVHRRKTGAIFVASLLLGGLAVGATDAQRQSLAEYGRALGLAFQITDDLLDVRGDAAAVGKRVGKDAGLGKITFPGVLGIDESVRRAEQLVERAQAALAPLGLAAGNLEALARYVLERNH